MKRFKLLKVLSIPLSLLGASLVACSSAPPTPAANANPDSAATTPDPDGSGDVCGPQSPRDITLAGGENTGAVPQGETPNLCNVHFHEPFEHAGFRWAGDTPAPSGEEVCKSVDHGDEIEFHWVYTNCDLPDPPLPGLENCVCDRADMVLRVFAQGYVVDEDGADIKQPSANLVQYQGSTTGPSYSENVCSPARVNWEVNPDALALSKASLQKWCESNPWAGEDHPHESRPPVKRADWLSPFSP